LLHKREGDLFVTLEIASDRELDVVEVHLKGAVELAGMNSALQSIINFPDWQPGKSIIFDYSDLDFAAFTTKDMRLISDLVVRYKASFGMAKWAFIISGDLQFGLMRMWEIITEDRVPMNINLFKSRPDARAWISGIN
jgi:hypothetical protein